jgi:hypothetical protein
MTKRQRENLIYGGIALGSGVFLVWIIPVQTPPYPGYGVSAALLPNVAFGLILALSVLLLAFNLFAYQAEKSKGASGSSRPAAPQIRPEEKVHFWRLALFLTPCFLLMPAMKWIGFIPAGLLFMLVIQYLCGQRKPVILLLVAVIPVVIMYAAMRYGLKIPMP